MSLAVEDLEWAREKVSQGAASLSAVLTEALRRQRQSEARRHLLEELGTDDITQEDLDAVQAEQR